MTEASSSFPDFIPEFIDSEPLTPDTYSNLLDAVHELHVQAKQGETYGKYHVTTHTESYTEMSNGHSRLVKKELHIEEIPEKGVLIRNILTSPKGQSDSLIQRSALLLGKFEQQPKIIYNVLTTAEPEASMPLMTRILLEGVPLNEENAKLWTEDILGLQAEHQRSRLGKAAELLQRLVKRG